MFKLLSLFACVAIAAQAQPAQAQPRPGAGPNLYSREKEAALGAELARQVERTAPPVDNPDALKYVQQVGARLAMQLPDAPFPYTFALIGDAGTQQQAFRPRLQAGGDNSPVIDTSRPLPEEPVALPGGYIFVSTRLFLTARDESEFAGMLAHAMSHAAERHATRQATRGTIGQMATIPLIFYGGWVGFGARQASSVAIPIALFQFNNAYEEQADADAVKMASGAGYDPEGLLRVLVRDQNTSTARLDALRADIGTPAPSSNDEFLRLQNQLRNPPRN